MNLNTIKLSEISEVVDSLHKSPQYSDSGFPMVRVTDVKRGYLDISGCNRVSEEVFKEFNRKYSPKTGDIIMTRVGTYGVSALVGECGPFCLGQNTVVIKPKKIDSRLLYHYLQTPFVKNQIEQLVVGSTQKTLSLKAINNLDIPIFDRRTEEYINTALSAIDDKIHTNNQINENLETIAKAIFKEWFIDYGPVKAKLEGKKVFGMDDQTMSIFPDSFEESELGMIPKGWKVSSIYEVADVFYGAPFSSKKFKSVQSGLPIIRIRDLKDQTPGIYTDEILERGFKTYPGQILVGMDGEFRAYIWSGPESWVNQRICEFRPKDFRSFVYFAIQNPLHEIESTETATTVIHLGKNDIDRFRIVLPNDTVLKKFEESTNEMLSNIVVNNQETRTLISLRDLLIPRLISGELQFGEASGD